MKNLNPREGEGQIHDEMSTKTQHTSTPWTLNKNEFLDNTGALIGSTSRFNDNDDANTEFIVRAVNAHEALLRVKEDAKRWLEYCQAKGIGSNHDEFVRLGIVLEKAIALAEGGK